MQIVQIKAAPFFDMLKVRDTSMWSVFAQMIDGTEKQLAFVDQEDKVLFSYHLPATIEQLKEDQKKFSTEYAQRIAEIN